MAFTYIDETHFEGATNGGTTPSIDTTGATLITIYVCYYVPNPPTISDSKGNTWIPLTQYVDGLTDGAGIIYYCINPTAGSGHTFSTSGANSYGGLKVVAFSSTSTPIYDQNNGNANNALTIQTGNITPSNANNLFFCGATWYGVNVAPMTIDSSFNIGSFDEHTANNYGSICAYKIATGSGSENPTFTGVGTNWFVATIANFYESSSSSIKTVNGLVKANVKTVNGLAIGSVKNINNLI